MPLVTVRRARLDDAPVLARLLARNEAHLAPWEPTRRPDWATEDGQRRHLDAALELTAQGSAFSGVIEADGEVVGRINLNTIVRGVFRSADLGYWVAQEATGRGVGTRAVGHTLLLAFGALGLHRVQAGTLLHNTASQNVLLRNGFERIGVARSYLQIAGKWQDHLLFQRVADEP